MYLFSWQPTFAGGIYGAMHGLEIPFVFGRLSEEDRAFTPKRTKETEILSTNMMKAWTFFAQNSNPNHYDIPDWPCYDNKKRSTFVFGNELYIWEDPLKKEREMWNNMTIWKNFFKRIKS